MGTGWERNNRTHFDEIVVNYDRVRPEYPGELLADIADYIGASGGKKALEIGAGTGKATAPFLEAGYGVTAVEIGANMAEFLRGRFASCGEFQVINDSFEDASLEEGGYDLIYAASAFHWVNAEIGCPKAFRLLKRGGAIALFRYNAVSADGEELYEEIQTVYQRYFHKPYIRPAQITNEERKEPAEIRRGYGFEDLRAYGFGDVTMKLYDAARTFSADEYIIWLDTMSDHRHLPEGDREALYAGIKEAISGHGGFHKVDFVFQLYMGKKR